MFIYQKIYLIFRVYVNDRAVGQNLCAEFSQKFTFFTKPNLAWVGLFLPRVYLLLGEIFSATDHMISLTMFYILEKKFWGRVNRTFNVD